jgi:hypothetical protein
LEYIVENAEYEKTIARTKAFFEAVDVHALPEIFQYWCNK